MYMFTCVLIFTLCFWLIGYCAYQDIMPIIRKAKLEEEEIFHRFAGNLEKIRFYRGFKKYFDGDLDQEELRQWFIDHPRKIIHAK